VIGDWADPGPLNEERWRVRDAPRSRTVAVRRTVEVDLIGDGARFAVRHAVAEHRLIDALDQGDKFM
jgi:hypothetical protein